MNQKILSGILLDEHTELSLDELCQACTSSTEWIIELVAEGALEPLGQKPLKYPETQWRFSVNALQRARKAMRLQRDLGLDLAGIALALDLLDEIESLEARLRHFEMR